jgi:hypothetical protein
MEMVSAIAKEEACDVELIDLHLDPAETSTFASDRVIPAIEPAGIDPFDGPLSGIGGFKPDSHMQSVARA